MPDNSGSLRGRPVAVVLVRPHTGGNVGSVARAAKNFGVGDLRVVEPGAAADEEAFRLASGADDLLGAIRRCATLEEAIADFGAVISTSSLRGREEKRFLSLAELPEYLETLGGATRVAFVFGPERSGLTEEERARSAACLRLPTTPGFPTLNVSHAVAVVLATVRAFERSGDTGDAKEEWSLASEVDSAVGHWDRALEAIGFYDTGHRERSLRDWRRLVAARPLTRREVAILRGVANRILVSLKRRNS